jgi:putative DNA primase/helicase
MVAIAQDSDGRPRGLHCTYIASDGSKAFGDRSRLMFGRLSGCAVRLCPAPINGVLAVAEGIENAGSYSTLRGVPCWSALSTSGLIGFVLPGGVRRLIIAADGDDAGKAAAQSLAERASRSCAVIIDPAPDGRDWNDVLRGDRDG